MADRAGDALEERGMNLLGTPVGNRCHVLRPAGSRYHTVRPAGSRYHTVRPAGSRYHTSLEDVIAGWVMNKGIDVSAGDQLGQRFQYLFPTPAADKPMVGQNGGACERLDRHRGYHNETT